MNGTSRVFRTHSGLFPPSVTRLSDHLTEVKVGPALRERVDRLKKFIEEKYGDFVKMQGWPAFETQTLGRRVEGGEGERRGEESLEEQGEERGEEAGEETDG
uniref:Orange domain-containing protein n=1 Tax=Chromera velia CCMP2878 TaxID=1169474 RepID=A0A0G4GNS0_9ALVE|eukprot:Cvel_22700.t1-p1 / transcript=Cvel_22700.t1 / gene=Cvel_22700 / organism=Chromera_velia_CCMP2878 / gene_product=hypothetical protein / transcript_product=hypothetical protein / location=Cvel_scaffold2261:7163-7465(+) / protein_length=101 / sequence_SO=supercontig / SO=protein_coding / is_pseudo=false